MPGPGYAFLGDEERANVAEVLSNWDLTRYAYDVPEWVSFVQRFEIAAQDVFSSAHCIAVNSGTSALITALAALGIGPGDEVIVPGYTFIASIGSIVYSGATPVLAEIDESLTLDPQDVEARITPDTRAIMAVHMLGAPCDLDALRDIARRHDLFLIEDTAQACGASYRGRRLGTIGEIGAFSLNPFKVITSGEGGFVLTSDPRLYQRAYAFQDQGWFPLRTDTGEGDVLFGLNLRMAELSGAVACAQLDKLDAVLKSTRQLKRALVERIPERPGIRRRVLHDSDGECATLLVHLFDRPEDAVAAAEALGTKTMIRSGRHYYGNMPQLTALATPGANPAPFRRPPTDGRPAFRLPRLPRTDDILARAVAISIGVSDRYLGSGFGLTVSSSEAEVDTVAASFNATLDGVL
ncbi:DegT/DnrJ/EryC1/StrS family aminotransferase [Kitasatospora sp. NPDC098652]|uniref:DegT/DnrJ/EryC1/StrS family aminotransferase n=1 Tax=Kitasatospora sp. NPDC098652 TaxID=3364095 RepID=UPI003811B35C